MTAVLEGAKRLGLIKFGGLNTETAPDRLEPDETPSMQNWLVDEIPGALVKPNGYLTAGTSNESSAAVTFLFPVTFEDGSTYMLVSNNGTVRRTQDFQTFTSLITGLSTAYQLRAQVVRNKIWFTNGNDSVRNSNSSWTVTVLDGTGATPNVPKGKYIAMWQERVWMLDTGASDRSTLSFSALVNSSGTAIAPDNSAAWPAANTIYVGQGDGDFGFGLKVFRNQLYVFKGKSIWAVAGQDEYSYRLIRLSTTTGCRFQESIVERDNVLEFIGNDGIYLFDGQQAQRVSDKIRTLFYDLSQPFQNFKLKTYTTQSDFDAGTKSSITSNSDGSFNLTLNQTTVDEFTDGDYTANPAWTVIGSFFTAASNYLMAPSTSTPLSGSFDIYTPSTKATGIWEFNFTMRLNSTEMAFFFMSDSNVTKAVFTGSSNVNGYSVNIVRDSGQETAYIEKWTSGSNTILTPAASWATGTYQQIRISRDGSGNMVLSAKATADAAYTQISSITDTTYTTSTNIRWALSQGSGVTSTDNFRLDNIYNYSYAASGTWTSANTQLTTGTITSWGAFQASPRLYGQTATYSIRSATTQAGLSSASFNAITPGSVITEPLANIWVNVRVALSTTDNDVTPVIDDVTVNWVEGGTATQNVVAIAWKNRSELCAARISTASASNDVTLVHGKKEFGYPWMRRIWPSTQGFTAFAVFNDQLYGGSASSDGRIYRMDYTDSANGTAIDSRWLTKDIESDAVNGQIKVLEGDISCTSTANTSVTVGISRDSGTTFDGTDISVSIGAAKTRQQLFWHTRAKQAAFRLRHNTVGPCTIYKCDIFFRDEMGLRSP